MDHLKPLRHVKDRIQSLGSDNPWIHRPGTQAVPIASLVSPLRYDILVRMRYFQFFEQHRERFERDFASYAALARELPYFTWFDQVVCRHNGQFLDAQKRLPTTPRKRDRAFDLRLQKAARLYHRFERAGFDRSFPITLMTGQTIHPSTTGKRIDAPLFAGDGCHRIALLLARGCQHLEPHMYRIRCYREFHPLDNTALLLRDLRVDSNSYYRFLSLRYADREMDSARALLEHVKAHRPRYLAELEQVMAVDRRYIGDAA